MLLLNDLALWKALKVMQFFVQKYPFGQCNVKNVENWENLIWRESTWLAWTSLQVIWHQSGNWSFWRLTNHKTGSNLFYGLILKILSLYIILSYSHMYHFFPVSIHSLLCIHCLLQLYVTRYYKSVINYLLKCTYHLL